MYVQKEVCIYDPDWKYQVVQLFYTLYHENNVQPVGRVGFFRQS